MEIHKGEVFVVAVFLEKLRQNNFIFGEKQIKEVKLNKTYLELKTEEESLNLDFEELAELSEAADLIDLLTKNSEKEEVFWWQNKYIGRCFFEIRSNQLGTKRRTDTRKFHL